MGYQMGTIGPITYHQDNSGINTDQDNTLTYTPEMFGAPPGSQIVTPMVQQTQHVSRGKAYLHNVTISPNQISFEVYTQAANDGLFGWHSGAIDVTTTFMWFCITAAAVDGGDALFSAAPPPAGFLNFANQTLTGSAVPGAPPDA